MSTDSGAGTVFTHPRNNLMWWALRVAPPYKKETEAQSEKVASDGALCGSRACALLTAESKCKPRFPLTTCTFQQPQPKVNSLPATAPTPTPTGEQDGSGSSDQAWLCPVALVQEHCVLQTLNGLERLLDTAMAFTQAGRRKASWPPLPPFRQGLRTQEPWRGGNRINPSQSPSQPCHILPIQAKAVAKS